MLMIVPFIQILILVVFKLFIISFVSSVVMISLLGIIMC